MDSWPNLRHLRPTSQSEQYRGCHNEEFSKKGLTWPPQVEAEMKTLLGSDVVTNVLSKLPRKHQETVYYVENVVPLKDLGKKKKGHGCRPAGQETVVDIGASLKATVGRVPISIPEDETTSAGDAPLLPNTIPPLTGTSVMWLRQSKRVMRAKELLRGLGVIGDDDSDAEVWLAMPGDQEIVASVVSGFLVAAATLATFASSKRRLAASTD